MKQPAQKCLFSSGFSPPASKRLPVVHPTSQNRRVFQAFLRVESADPFIFTRYVSGCRTSGEPNQPLSAHADSGPGESDPRRSHFLCPLRIIVPKPPMIFSKSSDTKTIMQSVSHRPHKAAPPD